MSTTNSTINNNEQREAKAPIAADQRLRICKAASVSAPATPCTVGEMNRLLNSLHVRTICQQVRALPDDEAHAEERARLKKSLPVLCFNAREFADNKRCNAGAKPSGLCLMDIDHAGDVDAMVESWGPKDQLPACGVYMVQRSVSGNGLHLVIGVQPGESIAQAQERVARNLGIKDWDRACREMARASFVSPVEDVMFFWPEAFIDDAEEMESSPAVEPQTSTDIIKVETAVVAAQDEMPDIEEAEVISEPKEVLCYRGVPYQRLTEGILKEVMGLDAEPSEGSHTRHNTYIDMLGYLRYLCDNDPALMLRVAPDWGLPTEERQQMCQSVAAYAYKAMPRKLRVMTDRMVREQKAAQQAGSTNWHRPLPERLPRFFRLLLKIFPEQFHRQVVMASFVMLGTLTTALRYKKNAYEVQATTFMSVLWGHLGSGKGFLRVLSDILLGNVIEQDERAAARLQQWRDDKEAAGNGRSERRPHLILRQVYPDFTMAALNQQIKDAQEQHLIFFAEEIDDFKMDQRFSSKLRQAYDGVRTGQSRVSAQSVSGGALTHINVLTGGTPEAVRRAFPNSEDGLVSRFSFIFMPDSLGFDTLKWTELSRRENDELQRRINDLYRIGLIEPAVADEQREDEMPKEFMQHTYEKVFIKLPRAEQRIKEWTEQIQAEIDTDPSKVALGRFVRRIPDHMRRVAMVLYACEGKRETSEMLDLMVWMGEETLQNLLELYGNRYEEIYAGVNATKTAYIRNHNTVDLYAMVDNRFTLKDLISKRRNLGLSDNEQAANTTISRWKKRGLIRIAETGEQGERIYAKVLRLESVA